MSSRQSGALFLTCVLLCSLAPAQEGSSEWVRGVSGEARLDGSITQIQAEQQARNEALAEALKRKGIRVSTAALLDQSESVNTARDLHNSNVRFVNIVQTATQGIVTAIENERWRTIETPQADPSRPPIHTYRVTLDARVTIPQGSPDPDFKIEPELDKVAYRDGDHVILRVTSTKKCYLHIFNIAADSVVMLVPSGIQEPRLIAPDEPLYFPPDGYSWTAQVPSGWPESEELVMVVATTSDRSFTAGEVSAAQDYVATRHAARTELMSWIATIPQSEVAYAWETLRIVQK